MTHDEHPTTGVFFAVEQWTMWKRYDSCGVLLFAVGRVSGREAESGFAGIMSSVGELFRRRILPGKVFSLRLRIGYVTLSGVFNHLDPDNRQSSGV